MTDAPETDASFLAPVSGAGFWSVCHGHKARIDNRKKNLLSTDMSCTCPHNMVNLGPLAAEIHPIVWGTPANFNGFRVLAALLHGI